MNSVNTSQTVDSTRFPKRIRSQQITMPQVPNCRTRPCMWMIQQMRLKDRVLVPRVNWARRDWMVHLQRLLDRILRPLDAGERAS